MQIEIEITSLKIRISHPQPQENPRQAIASAVGDVAGGLHAYIGQHFGKSIEWVKDRAYVMRLGGKARQLLADGRIGAEAARELAKLGDVALIDDLAAARGPSMVISMRSTSENAAEPVKLAKGTITSTDGPTTRLGRLSPNGGDWPYTVF